MLNKEEFNPEKPEEFDYEKWIKENRSKWSGGLEGFISAIIGLFIIFMIVGFIASLFG